MNAKSSLIRELVLYKLKPDYNAAKATKIICCVEDEGTVDHIKVAIRLKKLCLGPRQLTKVKLA